MHTDFFNVQSISFYLTSFYDILVTLVNVKAFRVLS
jgi:hypothetical protein